MADKKVITYGTFDLLHYGHVRLLERAKALGNYLIVGVTTDGYDQSRGKLNVQQSLAERMESIRNTGLADEIIAEDYEGQKIEDIRHKNADIFAIGSDWKGHFDYLGQYCSVVYLERTRNISSTEIRNQGRTIRLGVVGTGRIAGRFVGESRYVSGLTVKGCCSRTQLSAKKFCDAFELDYATDSYDALLENVDAVYVATPHTSHYEYTKEALSRQKHVLCEKPLVLSAEQAAELYLLAKKNGVVLFEAIKTAYCMAFNRLVHIARTGIIGDIKCVEATFTKLMEPKGREFSLELAGGAVTELASYPLLAIVKLLGTEYKNALFYTYKEQNGGVDLFTKIDVIYPNAIATAKVGLGVKSEGELIISGTKGYIVVPAPWWKTESFEARFEDTTRNKKYFYKFDGDGLRYELANFVKCINGNALNNYLTELESVAIAEIIGSFLTFSEKCTVLDSRQ